MGDRVCDQFKTAGTLPDSRGTVPQGIDRCHVVVDVLVAGNVFIGGVVGVVVVLAVVLLLLLTLLQLKSWLFSL